MKINTWNIGTGTQGYLTNEQYISGSPLHNVYFTILKMTSKLRCVNNVKKDYRYYILLKL